MLPPRYLYRALKYRWQKDRRELALLRSALPPGGIAVDIGAHKGAYLYWLQRWAGPAGRVYAFEPQPLLAVYLQRISSDWPQVEVHGTAVSSQYGEKVQLVLPPGATGTSPGAKIMRVDPARDLPLCTTATPLLTVNLDSLFQNTPPPDVIKCDSEGHELEVFQGAQQLLKTYHPALLFECESRHRGVEGTQPVFEFLWANGYKGWRIDPDGLCAVLEGKSPPAHRVRPGNNYWFCKA